MIKENLRITLRFVLANSFKEEENKVATRLVKDIYASCPTLFATLLLRSEQAGLKLDDDNDELEGIASDIRYINPTAVSCIQAKYNTLYLLHNSIY